jgi:hypothetical protein
VICFQTTANLLSIDVLLFALICEPSQPCTRTLEISWCHSGHMWNTVMWQYPFLSILLGWRWSGLVLHQFACSVENFNNLSTTCSHQSTYSIAFLSMCKDGLLLFKNKSKNQGPWAHAWMPSIVKWQVALISLPLIIYLSSLDKAFSHLASFNLKTLPQRIFPSCMLSKMLNYREHPLHHLRMSWVSSWRNKINQSTPCNRL